MKSIVIVGRNLLPGGAERVIVQLANYFVSQGIATYIITMDLFDEFYKVDDRIVIKKIAKESKFKLKDKIYRYGKLRKIIAKINPDVVLSMPEDIGIYVILALRGLKIPVVVSERNNPWIMPDVLITRILRKLMYPFAAGVVFQTEMAKSYFSYQIQKKGRVICNPIDENRLPTRYQGKRRKCITAIGRLSKQKNIDLLIDSFNDFHVLHKEYSLEIYGRGDLQEQLQSKINKYHLQDYIKLCGVDTDVLEKIMNCSMYIMTSDYEGMPNALLEAMCIGMPVISTDCPSGGPRELIKNHVNGILINVGNRDELIKAMEELCDEKVAEKYGQEAYKLRGKYASLDVFEDWKKYIEECI